MRRVIVAVASLFLASGAQAYALYSYSGNNFDQITADDDPPVGSFTTAMNISGSFTVDAVLGEQALGFINPLLTSYAFSNGRYTFNESNSTLFNFQVEVDAGGNLTQWDLHIRLDGPMGSIGDERSTITIRNNVLVDVTDWTNIEHCISNGSPCNTALDVAFVDDNPGGWTATVVPLPATVFLYPSALVVIGLVRRRKRPAAPSQT